LFRAVDGQGQTVDFYLSETRHREAAKLFLKKALANADNRAPHVFARDGLWSYRSALRELQAVPLRYHSGGNAVNRGSARAEPSHQTKPFSLSFIFQSVAAALVPQFLGPHGSSFPRAASGRALCE